MQERQNIRWMRWALVAAVLLALLTMALWPNPLKVDSTVVTRGLVQHTLEAEGRTRLRQRYLITAPMAASARRIELAPGDPVRAGQVLAMLDPLTAPALDARSRLEAQARLAAAQAQWRSAQTVAQSAEVAATLSRDELQRLRPLADQGMVSKEALQRAATALQRSDFDTASARFQSSTAAHQVELAQAALRSGGSGAHPVGTLALRSPVDGVVLRRSIESARTVMAGDALIEVGDPAALEVAVDVLSSDAVMLQPGMRVDLLRWGEAGTLAGEVQRIEPGAFTRTSALGVEEQRVWVVVGITSPRAAWQRLGDAYRVHARFVLREANDALRAPGSALFRHGEGWAVFRVEGGMARLRVVKAGLAGDSQTQVLDGLAQGDLLVVHPPRELKDGTRVELP